jgi:RNA polymerase sigma-70 factor (ECF subfamily)
VGIPGQPQTPTELLLAWQEGQESAFAKLVPLVQQELQRIARRHMKREQPGQTLQATALVNEAYMRLMDLKRMRWEHRAHFFAMSARIMRRVLVDRARARKNQKRGGAFQKVTLGAAIEVSNEPGRDLVALDDALQALAQIDPRKAQVIELRFFGGLSVEETAEALEVSPDTVMRDWRIAKLWLFRELRKD